MVSAIFENFDEDCDGFLNMDELNEWGQYSLGASISDEDYVGFCQTLSSADSMIKPAEGLRLSHFRLVYSPNTWGSPEQSDLQKRLGDDFSNLETRARRNANLRFYLNRDPYPGGVLIEEFHSTWRGDYQHLELAHDYIQWLFPSPETSNYNWQSQELTDKEAAAMRENSGIMARMLVSLEIMLDFFGFHLGRGDDNEIQVVRKSDAAEERLQNLADHQHNFLRISRILTCTTKVGMHKYQLPIMFALGKEVFVTGILDNAVESYRNFWIPAMALDDDKDQVEKQFGPYFADSAHEIEPGQPAAVDNTTEAAPAADGSTTDGDAEEEGHTLAGAVVYIDPESGFSAADCDEMRNELLSNGAQVPIEFDLDTCTHLLCERSGSRHDGGRFQRTTAYQALAAGAENDEHEVIAVNWTWVRACLKAKRLLPVDLAVQFQFQPHRALLESEAAGLLPAAYRDHWDDDHVKLPCSPQNRLDNRYSRWSYIVQLLQEPIDDIDALASAIGRISNGRFRDFSTLAEFFGCLSASQLEAGAKPAEGVLSPAEQANFFKDTLPAMARLALELPATAALQNGLPLLRQGVVGHVTLPQRAVACLLANAFFCTFPPRPPKHCRLPTINFGSLYKDLGTASWGARDSASQIAKLRCIVHYFWRATHGMPEGNVSFGRTVDAELFDWVGCQLPVCPVKICGKGGIEDAGGCLQVDFANKVIGGGVLGHGAVQEEIRFAICAECLASRLLTEVLRDNEAVVIRGAERFCSYRGYSTGFRFAGDFADGTPRDQSGHRETFIVAMDATRFERGSASRQYLRHHCEREAGKALVAFRGAVCGAAEPDPGELDPECGQLLLRTVATGNWGCGVFGGDKHHKALLQAIATTVARRPAMHYYTVGNEEDMECFTALFHAIADRCMRVGDVWAVLLKFGSLVAETKEGGDPDFRVFLRAEGLLPAAEEVVLDSPPLGGEGSPFSAESQVLL
jgi:poly(ADP-ribose) glycohydrolase